MCTMYSSICDYSVIFSVTTSQWKVHHADDISILVQVVALQDLWAVAE